METQNIESLFLLGKAILQNMKNEIVANKLQNAIEITQKMWNGEVFMENGEKFEESYIRGYLQGTLRIAIHLV